MEGICTGPCPGTVWIHKPATAATGGRVKKAGDCVKLWLAGIYFLVHAIFVASKLWIWQQNFNFWLFTHNKQPLRNILFK